MRFVTTILQLTQREGRPSMKNIVNMFNRFVCMYKYFLFNKLSHGTLIECMSIFQ